MANLGRKNGVYLARFRFLGAEYKKSLRTTDRKAADAAMHRVEEVLHRLAIGLIVVPEGIDPGDFVVSGGTLKAATPRQKLRAAPTLNAAIDEYLNNLGHLAESHRCTAAVHLRNLKSKLAEKVEAPLDRIEQRDLEGFLQARLRERAYTTVGKERDTAVGFFAWAVANGYLAASPAAGLTRIKAGGGSSPFRTVPEIQAIQTRGGLGKAEAWALWDCVYLSPAEIAGVLEIVRRGSKRDVSFLLHAVPAYTGMRRGEVLRLRWVDVEFDQNSLIARSMKQSRQAVETKRRIELHPELIHTLAKTVWCV